MSESSLFTFQTRIKLEADQDALLRAYAQLYSTVERKLFAVIQANPEFELNATKREFLKKYDITARQFNAIRTGLQGKISAIQELNKLHAFENGLRIEKAKQVLAKLEKIDKPKTKVLYAIHQKKRRLHILETRQAKWEEALKSDRVSLCFGSKDLFRKQFHLEENNLKDHAEWEKLWDEARNKQFFVLGSKDESAGCQGCQAEIEKDGSLTLRLRLPAALKAQDTIEMRNVRFAYGHEHVLAALKSSHREKVKNKKNKEVLRLTGTALSYRFIHDDKGWRVMVSCPFIAQAQTTHKQLGSIGMDMNANHWAISRADRFGNLIDTFKMPMLLQHKSSDQTKAILGDMAKELVAYAKQHAQPVVVEALDFKKKKAQLEKESPKRCRQLSSFAYSKALSSIKSAALRAGVEVIEVNPAFTSTIGAVNHAKARGISIHQGAALAVARRGLGWSEKPTVKQGEVPLHNGVHVTFTLPARKAHKHVWTFWSQVRSSLKAAQRAHYRREKEKSPPTIKAKAPSACAAGNLRRDSVTRIRQDNCSPDVLGDVPL